VQSNGYLTFRVYTVSINIISMLRQRGHVMLLCNKPTGKHSYKHMAITVNFVCYNKCRTYLYQEPN